MHKFISLQHIEKKEEVEEEEEEEEKEALINPTMGKCA